MSLPAFKILVVSTSPERSTGLRDILKTADYEVMTALGFEEAVRILDARSPELMISDIRLGGFNGLHLVIRSHSAHRVMRAIVLDRARDPVLQADAERHAALYLVEPAHEELLAHVSRIRAEMPPPRRWPRKELPEGLLVAHVAHGTARVVDLSYGGLRLELHDPADVASGIDVRVPGFNHAIQARPVWTGPAPSGSFWCGAQLSETNPHALSTWRRLVDSYMTPTGAGSAGLGE